MTYAGQVFDEFPEPHVFLWNALISGYAKHCLKKFYLRMRLDGVFLDCFTFPYLLKACGGLPSLCVGNIVHGHIQRSGFHNDHFLQNGLVAL